MKEKHPGGRPTDYKEEYNEQVYKLCLLGATDIEIADFIGVCEATINNWKKDYPKFLESIKDGKIKADAEIAESLYNRAKGYQHPDTHISNYQGEITETPIIKHYPPDTGAAMAWLKNRQPKLWRDKQEIQIEDISEKPLTREEKIKKLASSGIKLDPIG
jgi:hypothetical protein